MLTPETISENGGVSTVTATLARRNSEATILTVVATPNSPPSGAYFLQNGATLTIAALQRASTGTITITAVDDAEAGPAKTVAVAATVTGGNGVAAPPVRELTISDDEGPPAATLVVAPALIGENNGVATVTARLAHPASEDATLTVAAAPVAPAVAADFSLSANLKLTITAGTTTSTGTVTITAADNDVDAPDKEAELTASVTGGNSATAPAAERLSITDDEATPAVTLALSETEIGEAAGSTTVTASLSGKSSQDTTITVTATGEVPSGGAHFTLAAGTSLTIAAGQTTSTGVVTIASVNDAVHGSDKRVRVAGDAANTHGVTGPADLMLTITEDEALPTVALALTPDEIGENGR